VTPGRDKGATTVEFAIVGAAFMSMLMLTFELGYQMLTDALLNSGGRVASRFGTTGATTPYGMKNPPGTRDAAIPQLVIQNSGGLLVSSRLTVSSMGYPSTAKLATGAGGAAGPGTAGQIVRYTLTYKQPYLTPVAAMLTASLQWVHTVTLTVLNEPFPSS
jgi:Flp pilus assembly protein TadG